MFDRDEIFIETLAGGVLRIRNNPSNNPPLADDHFPEGGGCAYAVGFKKEIICRIIAPNNAADNEELINVAVTFHYLLGLQPSATVHISRLGQDIGHIVALSDRGFRIIEMIRRHEMAPIIASARMLVGGRGSLLATCRNVRIEIEVFIPWPVAGIVLCIVAELYGSAFFTVDPDSEPLVVEAESFPGGGGRKEDNAQEAEKKELPIPTKAH